jgi:hypothetical protein
MRNLYYQITRTLNCTDRVDILGQIQISKVTNYYDRLFFV